MWTMTFLETVIVLYIHICIHNTSESVSRAPLVRRREGRETQGGKEREGGGDWRRRNGRRWAKVLVPLTCESEKPSSNVIILLRSAGATPWFADISTKPSPLRARIGASGPLRCSRKAVRAKTAQPRMRVSGSIPGQQDQPLCIADIWTNAHPFLARILVLRPPSYSWQMNRAEIRRRICSYAPVLEENLNFSGKGMICD